MARATRPLGGLVARSPVLLCLVQRIVLMLCNIPQIRALPVRLGLAAVVEEDPPLSPDSPTLWIYLAVAVGLVLLGGIFAGLTIALMGQDEIYLEVIKTSGEGAEKRHAAKVLELLKKGKHWVLVTLLLGNVITNETLPIVLDRSLGGGWPAVLGSTVLIVIFGEIIPQSVCVRYGLPIGAFMYWPVRVMMWMFLPIALPTAWLLDWLLGEDHGTTYKKAGLKTLVTMHKSLGAVGEQLNEDEVTIIGAVLDLREKAIGTIMTPMKDVFTMSTETILDKKAIKEIRDAGFSRIPIHSPDNPMNFVGMLLVKQLMGYDKDDCKPVGEFALATLPETSPEASCLDIINFFQEGKSHMVLVSDNPGRDSGALGVVTLEDVIEELIGEEIVDESDVFINVEQGIPRKHPAPRFRIARSKVTLDHENETTDTEEEIFEIGVDAEPKMAPAPRHASIDTVGDDKAVPGTEDLASSPRPLHNMRRVSSITATSDSNLTAKRSDRERVKYTPLNLASRPRQTRNKTVTIKPGTGSMGELDGNKAGIPANPASQPVIPAAQVGIGEVSHAVSAGKEAKDGVHALQTSYGSISTPISPKSPQKTTGSVKIHVSRLSDGRPAASRKDSGSSQSTIASLQERDPRHSWTQVQKRSARSGSITESIIETNGVKKVVLELTSSSSEAEKCADDGVRLPQPEREGKGKEREEAEGDANKNMSGDANVIKEADEDSAEASENGRHDENSKPGDDPEVKSGKKKRRRKRKKAGAAYAKAMAAAGRSIDEDDEPGAKHGEDNAGPCSEETPLIPR